MLQLCCNSRSFNNWLWPNFYTLLFKLWRHISLYYWLSIFNNVFTNYFNNVLAEWKRTKNHYTWMCSTEIVTTRMFAIKSFNLCLYVNFIYKIYFCRFCTRESGRKNIQWRKYILKTVQQWVIIIWLAQQEHIAIVAAVCAIHLVNNLSLST